MSENAIHLIGVSPFRPRRAGRRLRPLRPGRIPSHPSGERLPAGRMRHRHGRRRLHGRRQKHPNGDRPRFHMIQYIEL